MLVPDAAPHPKHLHTLHICRDRSSPAIQVCNNNTALSSNMADVPLLLRSDNSSSERRVTPSWTISQLKARLEPITGVPASCQRLSLKVASQPPQPIEAADEDSTQIGAWPLQAYAELQVSGKSGESVSPSCQHIIHTPPIPATKPRVHQPKAGKRWTWLC